MKDIRDNFVPYEESKALKELGFNAKCFGFYSITGHLNLVNPWREREKFSDDTDAPLWQQAFEFFREKYKLDFDIYKQWRYSANFKANETFYRFAIHNFNLGRESKEYILSISTELYVIYEEAQLECLRTLIKLVKKT